MNTHHPELQPADPAGALNGSPFCKKIRSGLYVDLANPQASMINLEDIAYALTNQCRYSGNVPFYSVAEHSIIAAELALQDGCSNEQVKAVLLHDANEAFLGDTSRPMKLYMRSLGVTAIDEMSAAWDKAIGERFCVDIESNHQLIKHYDNISLKAEKKRFWPYDKEEWLCLSDVPDRDVNWRMIPPDEGLWFLTAAWFSGLR